VINPLTDLLGLLPARTIVRPRPKIVFESASTPWPLDAVLQLRASHPTVQLLTPVNTDRVDSIVDAFRRGADAYIAGSSDPDADFAFIAGVDDAVPLYAPVG
jgi:DNA-binding NarL/FixJ family response regulator